MFVILPPLFLSIVTWSCWSFRISYFIIKTILRPFVFGKIFAKQACACTRTNSVYCVWFLFQAVPGLGVDDLEGGTQIATNTLTGLGTFPAFITNIWQRLSLILLAAFIVIWFETFKLMIIVEPLWTPTSRRKDRMLVDWFGQTSQFQSCERKKGNAQYLKRYCSLRLRALSTNFWKSSLFWFRKVGDCGVFYWTTYFISYKINSWVREVCCLGVFIVLFCFFGWGWLVWVSNKFKNHYISWILITYHVALPQLTAQPRLEQPSFTQPVAATA